MSEKVQKQYAPKGSIMRKRYLQSKKKSTAIRPRRERKKPDRYGKRLSAINHDAFFENCSSVDLNSSDKSTDENCMDQSLNLMNSEPICSNNEVISSVQNGEPSTQHNELGTVISVLNEILERVKSLETNTAKLEVRLRNLETRSNFDVSRSGISDSEKVQMGIPIESKDALDKCETDLKNDEMRQKMVRSISVLI